MMGQPTLPQSNPEVEPLIDELRFWQAQQRRLESALDEARTLLAGHDAALSRHELLVCRTDSPERAAQARVIHARLAAAHAELQQKVTALLKEACAPVS